MKKKKIVTIGSIAIQTLISFSAKADCFMGICGGGTIIPTPTAGDIGKGVGHVLVETGNVISLSEIGRKRDEEEARKKEEMSELEKKHKQEENEKRLKKAQEDLEGVLNDLDQARKELSQLDQIAKGMVGWENLIQNMVGTYASAIEVYKKYNRVTSINLNC